MDFSIPQTGQKIMIQIIGHVYYVHWETPWWKKGVFLLKISKSICHCFKLGLEFKFTTLW